MTTDHTTGPTPMLAVLRRMLGARYRIEEHAGIKVTGARFHPADVDTLRMMTDAHGNYLAGVEPPPRPNTHHRYTIYGIPFSADRDVPTGTARLEIDA